MTPALLHHNTIILYTQIPRGHTNALEANGIVVINLSVDTAEAHNTKLCVDKHQII
jgi:hypothetical protein